jgi:hypothetical protein
MKQYEYKKGDKVRIAASSTLHPFKIGETATVQEVSEHVLLCRRGPSLFYASRFDVEPV